MNNNLTIGVDIGGTRTKYGLIDINSGNVLHQIILPTEKHDAEAFLLQISHVINDCRAIAETKNTMLTGIGFGIPGFVTENGVVTTTYGFLDFMENYPLKETIEKQCQLPCLLDNDARIVSLGEALFGKGKNYKRVLTLTLGTGVGFGFVVNNQFTEPLPLAHMGGHIKITDDGEPCYCGKTGCLEALISASGILRIAEQTSKKSNNQSVEDIFFLASKGDANAISVIEKVIGYLHTAIHNYANLFAPDIIILGGGIAKGLKPWLQKIKGQNYLGPHPSYDFQLMVSELEELAGILGAAALFNSVKLSKT